MTTMPTTLPDLEPGCPVPLDTLGRLYRGGPHVLDETLARLSDVERARLALFCNARRHLRELGLKIAATCDEATLVRAAGSAGSILFLQSRSPHRREEFEPAPSVPSPRKVSLARLAFME
ncbi:MAG TPA: hypothetical protein VHL98_00570 [Microvirga sp.]|jgi:hypothetical protein|nr:hypothetical protein [Microvirga sp.]